MCGSPYRGLYFQFMNELRMFNSPEFGEVRVITGADNEPKFCLVDVCQTLGLNPSKIAQRLTDDVLSKYPIADALGSMYLKTVVYPAGIDGIRQLLKSKGYKKNRAQE